MAISAPRRVDRPVSELNDPINPTLISANAVVVATVVLNSAAMTLAESSLNVCISSFSPLLVVNWCWLKAG